MNVRSGVAEFVGTFLLVVLACGTAVLGDGRFGALGVAFAFGLGLTVLAYTLGPISGCHVNPAVTLGMLATRKVSVVQAVGYWIAQFAGALAGAAVVLVVAKGREIGVDFSGAPVGDVLAGKNALATNGFGQAGSPGNYGAAACIIVEIIATFLLVFTVLMTTDSKRGAGGLAGLIIGVSLFIGHLLAINVTNASINPARSFGPAVLVGGDAICQLWMFIVAPLAGAVVAAVLYMFLRGPAKADAK